MSALALEIQLQSKLKLSGVKRRSWLAVVTAVAGALSKGIYVTEQRRGRGFIEAVEHIETFGNQIQPDAFAEPDSPHHAQIE